MSATTGRWAKAAADWWCRLQPSQTNIGDRAALARLRRATSLAEAMTEPATLALFRRLGFGAADRFRLPRVAVIAMTLAHVREHASEPVMRRVGRRSFDDEDSAKLKPIRFRHLLTAREDDEMTVAMRRLVGLADRRLNVGDLAVSLLFWNDNTRARWAFDYFHAGSAAADLPQAS